MINIEYRQTCFWVQFCTGEFPKEYVPTIWDNWTEYVRYGDNLINFGCWDIGSGGEDFAHHRVLNYPQTNIFLMMFSKVSRNSFDRILTSWEPEIKYHCPNVPFSRI